jgi:protease IV
MSVRLLLVALWDLVMLRIWPARLVLREALGHSASVRPLLVALWDLVLLTTWPVRLVLRAALGHSAPPIVEVRLRGALRYRDHRADWFRLRSRSAASTPSLHRLGFIFRRLVKERRTLGVLLSLEDTTGSAAQWDALGKEIASLQANGKQVAIYAEALDGAAYSAICGARVVVMPPSGSLNLVGIYTELTSVGPALRQLGIRPEFVRRETYKTAPELFTESEPSPVQRAQADELLDQAFERLLVKLEGRSLSAEAARRVVDGGPYTGRTALAAGLIDEVLFHDQLGVRLAERWGAPKPSPHDAALPGARRLISSGRVARLALRPIRRRPVVGVVLLHGLIRSGRNGALPLLGSFCGSESAAEALERARRDRSVRSVVVAIESRGGSALASEIIWREIRRTADAKPTLIYVDRVAASGGYLAACGADRILASPLALVGSIGVFAGRFEVKDLLERIGIRREPLQRGARAGLGAKSGPLDETEREALEAGVEETYQAFLVVVAKARKKDLAATRELAQGKVFTAQEALPLGLLDGLCSFEEAIAEAAKNGGITGTDPPVLTIVPPGGAGLLGRVLSSVMRADD